jgi:hypothetical protein
MATAQAYPPAGERDIELLSFGARVLELLAERCVSLPMSLCELALQGI